MTISQHNDGCLLTTHLHIYSITYIFNLLIKAYHFYTSFFKFRSQIYDNKNIKLPSTTEGSLPQGPLGDPGIYSLNP